MAIQCCRMCGRPLTATPLLRYANMPRVAQNLPDHDSLGGDTGVDLAVCQCPSCGLVQLHSEPVPYYREVIRAAAVSAVVKNSKTEQFASFVDRFELHGKRIIEIGCGRGEFLSLLSSLQVDVYGLEYAEAAVRSCRESGLNVSRGYVDRGDIVLERGPFDAFLLLMFLEHMPDPNAALRGICSNLAEGGVGIVEVPNFDMVLRKNLFSEFTADHLLYFTHETLQTILQLNGFEILEFSETRDEYVLSAVVKKRLPLNVQRFSQHQEKIRTEIESFMEQFTPNRVAVWGAGHQALAIIALASLGGRIRYVVDSAPFKQGRFTPATHVRIVAPETLSSDPVDAVIIMAASYSDEVAALIRQEHSKNIRIAILRDFGLELVRN